MKKWVIGIVAVIVLAVGSVYVFIPSVITVSGSVFVRAYQNSITNVMQDSAAFNKWWRSVATPDENGFAYKGFDYRVNRALSNIADIQIQGDGINVQSTMACFNIYLDSCSMGWATQIEASANPITRIQQYNKAVALKQSMDGLLGSLREYLGNSANMYGIKVSETQAKDTLLISTKIKTMQYPTMAQVYGLAEKLGAYATAQGATPTNYPMLNVTDSGKLGYRVMVGLPISRPIAETQDIHIKRIPYLGNMLTARITGGPATIENAYKKMFDYYTDSRRTSPAIPYEMLITNRLQQPDTSKWVTQIFYPVM